jgi:hypothetical protein
MWFYSVHSALETVRRLGRHLSTQRTRFFAIALLIFAPLIAPLAASADTTGNWFLDDGSGHRLGAMLFERSDVNMPSGLRLRLNAESPRLKLDHARPLKLTDANQHSWSLANRSEELLVNAKGRIPAGSAQYEAGCLNPIPDDGIAMKILVPTSKGDLSFNLEPGQVQTLHSLTEACAS